MNAIRQEILPASGVSFATTLKLTPSTLNQSFKTKGKVLYNVVTARSNVLRVYEVRQLVVKDRQAVSMSVDDMDMEGSSDIRKTSARVVLLREHKVHGTVTGIERVRTLASLDDQLDRLLVSYRDAKIALLEWSEETADLLTVSLHTYERAPQLLSLEAPLFRAQLRVDSLSRCAALTLPQDALAIIPFHQTQLDLDMVDNDADTSRLREIPYLPSFIISLPTDVDQRLRNVSDVVFLPGIKTPTLAVLAHAEQTWAGLLPPRPLPVSTVGIDNNYGSAVHIFTLSPSTRQCALLRSHVRLPHDAFLLVPCPISIGGLLVLAGSSVVYLHTSARRVNLAVSGWAAREAPSGADGDVVMNAEEDAEAGRDMDLNGARAAFVDDRTALLVFRTGVVHVITLNTEGADVVSISLGPPLARTSCPTLLHACFHADEHGAQAAIKHLFVGSTTGESTILDVKWQEDEVYGSAVVQESRVEDSTRQENVPSVAMVEDEDAELYGDSIPAPTNASATAAAILPTQKPRTLTLSLLDAIPAWGGIADMAFSIAKHGERMVPELVCAMGVPTCVTSSTQGAEALDQSVGEGGFICFQRDVPTRLKKKLHALGGGKGMWALSLRKPALATEKGKEKERSKERERKHSVEAEAGELMVAVLSTDANPSPGLSRISTRTPGGDITIANRVAGGTVGCGSFFKGTAIVHIMPGSIRVLEPDGMERQLIVDVDGQKSRTRIRYASIVEPYILILREDDTLGLFCAAENGRKLRRKNMAPLGDGSLYLAATFWRDEHTMLSVEGELEQGKEGDKASEERGLLLFLVRPPGVLEIWVMHPKLSLVFSSSLVSTLPTTLVDSFDAKAMSMPEDPPRQAQTTDVSQIVVVPFGEGSSPEPHLFVFLRSGHLAIYSLSALATLPPDSIAPRPTLLVRFVHQFTRIFEVAKSLPDETTKAMPVLPETRRAPYTLIPFVANAPGPEETTLAGVFLTGDVPSWILRTDHSGIVVHPAANAVVYAFTACPIEAGADTNASAEFLMYTDEGPCLVEWVEDMELGTPLPSRRAYKERSYSHVVYEPSSDLVIAAAQLSAQFGSYDEDGNVMWEPDGPNITWPVAECSTLELMSSDTFSTMDGYEFATNEFVTAVELVSLETNSHESGYKEFIAVATTIDRGEDLAVKGAVYIFDIAEVVPDRDAHQQRWYKLRLLCRDDVKGPVTCLCGLNGYLVSSMGQKIYVRALDLDERLVGVAFLDVGIWVTSLRALKNLLVIGDAVKSVWFVAFQEDPYKLKVIAKDVRQRAITKADLFFHDSTVTILAGDEDGVLRVLAYDPADPESKSGQELVVKTEFHGQVEYRTSVTIARRTASHSDIPDGKLICGHTDGSLSALIPLEDAPFKRLQLLQGQLIGKVQHISGLNPRAFRLVRNDRVSKPLSKGIVDGNLLEAFLSLPVPRQEEFTKQIGTDTETIIQDYNLLGSVW